MKEISLIILLKRVIGHGNNSQICASELQKWPAIADQVERFLAERTAHTRCSNTGVVTVIMI